MKKRSLLGLNLFIILVACVYAAIMILGNVGVKSANIAAESGSYAKQYAEENHLKIIELSDSEKYYFDQRYEQFDYNVNNRNEITLENYTGSSVDLVIPRVIDNKEVVTLSENFMASLSSVKNLYISNTVKEIEGEPVKNLIICCADNCSFYLKNLESEWNFETVYDSTFVNYDLGDIEYSFNIDEHAAEITHYNGSESELLVIPAYINGVPVTEVSMSLLDVADLIVIPKTVTNISGDIVKALYSPMFLVELIFTVLAFLLTLFMVNVLMRRIYKGTAQEYMLTGNQIIAVIFYVVAQVGWSIYCIYFGKDNVFLAIVVSAIILVIFIAAVMLGGAGRKHVKSTEIQYAEKTSRMKSIKLSAKGLAQSSTDGELKKELQRLEDEIRFSDPVTTADLDDIEAEIEEKVILLKKALATEEKEKVLVIVAELLKKVQERNERCKAGK